MLARQSKQDPKELGFVLAIIMIRAQAIVG